MKEPIVIACVPETGPHRQHVVDACLELEAEVLFALPKALGVAIPLAYHNKRPAIAVSVGQEGCIGVAKEIEAGGHLGVSAIVLVGPEAPWTAPTPCEACRGLSPPYAPDRCGSCNGVRPPMDIGPLGAMRAIADTAKLGVACVTCNGAGVIDGGLEEALCPFCMGDRSFRSYPLRLILVCYPHKGACRVCGGSKILYANGGPGRGQLPVPCSRCKDEPKLLGADDMAHELVGPAAVPAWPMMSDWSRRDVGGVTTICMLTQPYLRGEGVLEALRVALSRGPCEEKD